MVNVKKLIKKHFDLMNILNNLSLTILYFLKNRSYLFYIFWLSFLIGEGTHQILFRVWGCSVFLNENKVMGYVTKITSCNGIAKGIVDICLVICFLTLIAYLFWYTFKCFRYIFRLGFKR